MSDPKPETPAPSPAPAPAPAPAPQADAPAAPAYAFTPAQRAAVDRTVADLKAFTPEAIARINANDNSKGEITRLQNLLTELGYDPRQTNPVRNFKTGYATDMWDSDGQYGNNSKHVMQYRRKSLNTPDNLFPVPDGSIDPHTAKKDPTTGLTPGALTQNDIYHLMHDVSRERFKNMQIPGWERGLWRFSTPMPQSQTVLANKGGAEIEKEIAAEITSGVTPPPPAVSNGQGQGAGAGGAAGGSTGGSGDGKTATGDGKGMFDSVGNFFSGMMEMIGKAIMFVIAGIVSLFSAVFGGDKKAEPPPPPQTAAKGDTPSKPVPTPEQLEAERKAALDAAKKEQDRLKGSGASTDGKPQPPQPPAPPQTPPVTGAKNNKFEIYC